MKLLDRYLLREMMVAFVIGLSAFLTILTLNMAYFVIDLVVEKDAPLPQVLEMILLRVPFFLALAMPVAILLATSLAVNRFTRDRELLAMRLAGLSIWRLVLPYALFGIMMSGLSFVVEEYVSPAATHQSDVTFRSLVLQMSVPSLTPDTFFHANDRVFYFHRAFRVGQRTLRLEQVMMYRLDEFGFPQIWTAQSAMVRGDVWTLRGVVMHILDEHGHVRADGQPDNPDHSVVLNLHNDVSFFANAQATSEEKTAAQLWREVADYDRLGVRGSYVEQQRYDLHSKFALPAACLLCGIVGIPLNIRFARFGGFVGLFLALSGVFVYYNCMVLAKWLVSRGQMPGVAAAWFPDVFLAVVCLALIWRES